MLRRHLCRTVVLLLVTGALPGIAAATVTAQNPPRCGGREATIVGTPGDDVLVGTARGDVIVGLGGDDIIDGGRGPDRICGGAGRDILNGEGGRDRILGGPGDDILRGEGRDDHLEGGKGRDALYAGAGVDFAHGQNAIDLCLGAETERGCERGPLPPGQAGDVVARPVGFSPDGFQCIGNVVTPPATTQPVAAPIITGSPSADARIRALAEARGYRLRPLANPAALVPVDGFTLHPNAVAAWGALRSAAAANGVGIALWSGYRSPTTQRIIFTDKLNSAGIAAFGRPFTSMEITAGVADGAIESILRLNSIPGYSKHHTGSTLDFIAPGYSVFSASPAFAWLSANNYGNARRFGFVPSYPGGAGLQGPDPEPWEYSHVGVAAANQGGDGIAIGKLESWSGGPTVALNGWAYDPSRPEATATIEVHAGVVPITARPARHAHFPLGSARARLGHLHRFRLSVTPPNGDDLCVTARDFDAPWIVRLVASIPRGQ